MAKLLLSDRILLEDNRIWKGGIFIDDRGYIDRLVNEDDVARGLMNKVFEGVEVKMLEIHGFVTVFGRCLNSIK